MSEKHRASWTPERRARKAEELRRRNQDPAFTAKRKAAAAKRVSDPAWKAAQSERAQRLNRRLKEDPELRWTWLEANAAANRRPEKRAGNARVMTETMARPALRDRARGHIAAVNRNPESRRRMTRTKRGHGVPPGTERLFVKLRRKVGADEALRLCIEEVRRARRRQAAE